MQSEADATNTFAIKSASAVDLDVTMSAMGRRRLQVPGTEVVVGAGCGRRLAAIDGPIEVFAVRVRVLCDTDKPSPPSILAIARHMATAACCARCGGHPKS